MNYNLSLHVSKVTSAPLTKPKKPVGARIKTTLLKRLHILEWLPHYTKSDILADFVAGVTVGLTMMPQSIAYAGLAGLQAQYGLYTAFIGSFTYVFFGTIKEVSIGPTSLMSLLTFSYVVNRPIEFVILLTFLAGCIELMMGILNLGFLVDFISPCLTSGFTSASAVIIIVAQMKNLLGIKIKSHQTFEVIQELTAHISETTFADTCLGVCCIIFLVCFKQLTKIPAKSFSLKKVLWFLSISKNAMIVLITTIIAYYLHNNGGAPFRLTGPVPKGLPEFGPPKFSVQMVNSTSNTTTTVNFVGMITSLGSGIIVIPIVAVLANVAIAKSYSSDVVVDASQEMMTLGLCNIFGSFVKAMPSCGAFTRSAVASSSGVRTPLQGIYSGSIIILALSLLAPYFYYIPKATLAAVLITAGSSLVDYQILPVLWKCNKLDFVMTIGTFVIGVVKDVETSIVVGAVFNALALLKMWSRPQILIEKRSNGTKNEYIYIKPELGLYYPAADYLTETIKKVHKKDVKLPIAVDFENILKVDYSASKTIETLINTYNTKHIKLFLLNVKSEVLETLKTVMDISNLYLLSTTENITERYFGLTNGADEVPLLERKEEENIISSYANTQRKRSLYEDVIE